MIKVEKTEKINHYKQIVKSIFLTEVAVRNTYTTLEEIVKRRRR